MQARQEEHPTHNLAHTVGRSTLFGTINGVVQVLTRLVTVPIVIHHLGLGGYGIWNVVMMTATYMRFGSVGVKTAFQKYVAEATGNGDYETANKLLSTGSAIMLVLSVAGLIPVACFSERIAQLSGVPPVFLKSAAASISLLAVIMLMSNGCAAFEGIVMGGHRIDLLRKYNTFSSLAEACGIVAVLHFGFSLAAMATVMGTSELLYLTFCYLAAQRVVPQIRLSLHSTTKSALYEFFRFAGSYQVVNLLDVVYNTLIPVTILRSFGANSAGVYAVVTRVVGVATTMQYSFLVPIVSAGAMVFASGSSERMQSLLTKAFKVTLGLSLLPLGFFAVFGPTVAYAWTGQMNESFRTAFWLVCACALFAAFSLLALVLYRATGKVLLDNTRQVLRISVIVALVALAPRLGFVGLLGGLAGCELAGMLFMFYALGKTFSVFRPTVVLPGMVRLSVAAVLIVAAGLAASYVPLPVAQTGRLFATLKLAESGVACLIVAWPLLIQTGSVTLPERKALFASVFPRMLHSKS
jgi:O-antigen/teichoic acid export membrane protein